MVSKNQIKLITGLQQKKYRKQHKLFIAEGVKVVQELLNSNFELQELYTTQSVFQGVTTTKIIPVTDVELKKISMLTTPNTCIGVFKIPDEKQIPEKGLIIALDDVRDPGNLGTIIRLCDWFGIEHLICSEQSVDVYNPKVVQATMGSIARVNVVYTSLEEYITNTALPIFGTFMDGENVYTQQLPQEGIIVMGNEANGISEAIAQKVTHKIAIPRFGKLQETESLNVATAAAVILSEFRRNFSGM
ncbi:RNA methyltransferase [Flavobacterium salilacus subsp. salilacus]|uniref:TrmH family RNA methyltransferase n=1 Tax=Flavobacterium TaxID=237 RepID=UPI0010758B73|nr:MULTISPECIES: RNA methyltransferase [Flavobacterium]KAF2519948.1 RNA methyltransferase [Flavobacterium salilacus subsp. salilacus]MBE1614141.1 RNA methyltransferase [Flavobacterium sp. SaA2.13]